MISKVDWAETPDSAVVPYDAYHLTVQNVTEEHSQNGKLMLALQAVIDAPALYKGSVLFNRFVLGTDDDPEADAPETWRRPSATDLKKFLIACYGDIASLSGDPWADAVGTIGFPFGAVVELKADNNPEGRDGQPNPYYGTERNNFKAYFNVQDANQPQPGTLASQAPIRAIPRAAGRPAAAPPPPTRPPARPVAAVAEHAPSQAVAQAVATPPSAPPSRVVPVRAAPPPRPQARPMPPPRVA